MNVVFLLLATAASAGNHAAPAPAPSSSCCGSGGGCGAVASSCASDCCDKPGLMDRLKGLFARKGNCCDQHASSCCTPAPAPCCKPAPVPCHKPTPAPCCQPAPKPCCAAVSSCSPCPDPCACKPSLCERIRGMFKKGGDCCQSNACDSGCGAVGHAPAAHPAPAYPAHPAPVHPAPLPGGHKPHNQKPPSELPRGQAAPQPGINPVPVPVSKPAEAIKVQPLQEKNAPKIEKKEDARLMPAPVVQPAAAKVETEVKNPFDSARRDGKRVGHAADYSSVTGKLSYVHADGGLWVVRYASLDTEDAHGGSVILSRDRTINTNYRDGDLVTVEGQIISDRASSRLGGPLYRVRNIVLVDRPQ